jgi:D-alanine-D-alanine ligase
VIVKPAAEDASLGIDAGAVCTSRKSLKRRIALMAEQWETVLVQEYVAGREFNVGFIGKTMLPISEITFDNMPEGSWPILTYASKWDE